MENQFQSGSQILISKLDEFIRKFYKNLFLRGLIYSTGIVLVFFLSISLLEYFGNFNSVVRTILFWSFISAVSFVFVKLILLPLAKLYRLGSILSYDEAASIIGKHFTEVQDKLINVLQLQRQSQNDNSLAGRYSALAAAGIEQKIKELKPVPFAAAIDLSDNRKNLKFALIPFAILALIYVFNKSILTGSTERLINHSEYYEKPAPFSFFISNNKLEAIQREDFLLNIKISGSALPAIAFIEIDGNQFSLEKESNILFNYLFKNVNGNIRFKLFADGVYSKEYELIALPNPIMLGFDVNIKFPSYLNKADEHLENTGDITIPEGSKVSWNFKTRNTRQVSLAFSDTMVSPNQRVEGEFSFSKIFRRSDQYSLSTSNEFMKNKDSIRYSIAVIPDQYPAIESEQQADSNSLRKFYFKGLVRDDYGLKDLAFRYRILNAEGERAKIREVKLDLKGSSLQQSFFHYWDLNASDIQAGEELEYYFEVWDNDGVNGSKSSRTTAKILKSPTSKELKASQEKTAEDVKSLMRESLKDAKALQKELAELDKKLSEKKSLSYDDRKKTEDLLNRQKELEKKVESLKNENDKKNKQQSENKEQNQDLAEKHEELRKLMEQLMTPEMKKMMEDLEKMLSQADKEKIQDQLDKMKDSNKDLEKELDRSLELFKELEVEQKLKEAVENLEKLAEKQEELSKQSDDKKSDSKELQQKQDELNKEFDELKKDLKDLEKKNQALESPKDLEKTDAQEESIDKDMEESSDELGENKKSSASKKQKSASDKMKDMAMKMKEKQEQDEEEQAEEDMESLRALLENLLKLSFDQEKLMAEVKTVSVANPIYLKMAQQQRKLKDDAKMIEDSLFALSKRVVQIQSIVNREIASVNDNMDRSIDYFQDRNLYELGNRQQLVMTSANNLALLLNEALSQMQSQAQSEMQKKQESKGKSQCKKPGGACKKPGSGKPNSAAQMRKMQNDLNGQMEELKKSLKEGQKPGDNKMPGQQPGGQSEQLAKIAAQQEMLRKELQRYNLENNKDGKGSLGNLDKLAQEMEKTETDLVNKIISNETMKRQQEILTRLLEAENAERERDMDEKRESKESNIDYRRNSDEFAAYKRMKEKEMELLKTVPPTLNPYYKQKVDDYFRVIESNE